jgi:hypothetical protein
MDRHALFRVYRLLLYRYLVFLWKKTGEPLFVSSFRVDLFGVSLAVYTYRLMENLIAPAEKMKIRRVTTLTESHYIC